MSTGNQAISPESVEEIIDRDVPQLSLWKSDVHKWFYDPGPQTKVVPQTPSSIIKSESRGALWKWRWPEVGKVLIAAREAERVKGRFEMMNLDQPCSFTLSFGVGVLLKGTGE